MSNKVKILILVSALILVIAIMISLLKNHEPLTPDKPKETSLQKPAEDLSSKERRLRLRKAYELKEKERNARIKEFMDSRMSLAEVQAELKEDSGPKAKIRVIAHLSGNDSSEALSLLHKLLDDESEEVRLEAIELIADMENKDKLASIEKAMDDESEDVRMSAVRAIGELDEGELLAKGLDDKSDNVRETAFDVIEGVTDDTKVNVCQYGIHSTYYEVQERSVEIISGITSRRSVDVLIDALRIDNKELKNDIESALDYLIGEDFKDHSEALKWWKQNRDKYTDELEEIENDDEN